MTSARPGSQDGHRGRYGNGTSLELHSTSYHVCKENGNTKVSEKCHCTDIRELEIETVEICKYLSLVHNMKLARE